jgi:hypothetical protein
LGSSKTVVVERRVDLSWNEDVPRVVTTTIKSSEQVLQNMAGLMQYLKLWAGKPNKHLLRKTSAFSMVDG